MCDCAPQDYIKPSIWVSSARGNVPPHAVCGGETLGCIVYVGRVNHFGEIILGTLIPRNGSCYVGWRGAEYAHHEYEVLCNPDGSELAWEWNTNHEMPAGALQGGFAADGERLYIGRKWYNGAVGIGTVVPSKKSLIASFFGKVYAFCDFEVLVCKKNVF